MKPHPRIRETIKWGGAAVTVLLVVVWIGSAWCSVGLYSSYGDGIAIASGCTELHTGNAGRSGWSFECDSGAHPAFRWWKGTVVDQRNGAEVHWVAFWPVLCCATFVTIASWRADARTRRVVAGDHHTEKMP